MYYFKLREAVSPTQSLVQVCKFTVGNLLRQIISIRFNAGALLEVTIDGAINRRRN